MQVNKIWTKRIHAKFMRVDSDSLEEAKVGQTIRIKKNPNEWVL